ITSAGQHFTVLTTATHSRLKPGMSTGLLARTSRFRLRVHLFNLLAVAFLHRTAPDFHAGGQSSVLCSELIGHQQHAFQLLKAGEILVYLVYDALIERLHLGITD